MGLASSRMFALRTTTILCVRKDDVAGFAGSTADAITLFERLESKLEEHPGQLERSCVEPAKSIRTEKQYREATMLVADAHRSLTLTGQGDVVEPHDGAIAVGSGAGYALAAAKALLDSDMTSAEVARKAMGIASEMCIYRTTAFSRRTLMQRNQKRVIENSC